MPPSGPSLALLDSTTCRMFSASAEGLTRRTGRNLPRILCGFVPSCEPKTMRAGIALGSNLGDRLNFLREARRFLFALHEEPGPFLCSKVYETEPVDCSDDSPRFLNAAVELTTSLAPLELLARLQCLEQKLGRPPAHGFHGPRTLDLDLLYCDNLQLSLDSLTLPHPDIAGRLFVLKPLNDICPCRILPGQTAEIQVLSEALINRMASPVAVHCETL